MKTLTILISALVGTLAVILLTAGVFAKTEWNVSTHVDSEPPYLVAIGSVAELRTVSVAKPLSIREMVLAMLAEEGIDTAKADRIIYCESTWKPTATNYNRDGSNDAGLWQINSIHGLSVEERMDIEKSTQFAIKLIKAQGWTPWVCNK